MQKEAGLRPRDPDGERNQGLSGSHKACNVFHGNPEKHSGDSPICLHSFEWISLPNN